MAFSKGGCPARSPRCDGFQGTGRECPSCRRLLATALECERSGADVTVILTSDDGDGLSTEFSLRVATLDGEPVVVGMPHLARNPELVMRDPLTGLPNRALLEDRIGALIRGARRRGDGVALLMLDLDGFKEVNDTGGHQLGDRVLRVAAERLLNVVRDADTVARLGGDEFVVVLGEVLDPADAGRVARELLAAVGQPILLGDRRVQVGCSIGVAMYPQDSQTAEGLLARADAAMYTVKNAGKNGVRFCTAVGSARGAGAPAARGPAWSGVAKLGIAELDAHHEQILAELNRALELAQGTSPSRVQEAHELLKQAIESCRQHFVDEEALMRARGVPTLEAHQRAHHGLLTRLEAASAEFGEGRVLPVAIVDLMVDHMESMDAAIRPDLEGGRGRLGHDAG